MSYKVKQVEPSLELEKMTIPTGMDGFRSENLA